KGSSRLFATTPLDERCYFRSGLTYNQKLIEYLTACENTKDVLSGRGKRGGPLRSATPVEALLGFALFALAFGNFAFAFCLAFALGRILGRHLFRIAFAFLLGLGFLRVTFSFIFGRYFLVFAFALGISLLLVGGRLLFVTHLFSRNSRGSHEHRSNQHNKKTFHQILLMDCPFLVRNEPMAVPPSARHDASFVPDALDACCVALIQAAPGLYINCLIFSTDF